MDILTEKRPKVLLLGNGLLRSFGNTVSWNELLKKCHKNERIDADYEFSKVSLPLEIVIRTEDNVDSTLKENCKLFYKGEITDELFGQLKSLLDCEFDYILTTNYGYEIEAVAANNIDLSARGILKYQRHIGPTKRADPRYLLHTFYEVDGNKIWHIHGESRKPSSMIIGHYYYCNLLSRYELYLKNTSYEKRQKKGEPQTINSWLDAFILGDVYVLGLGMDFSELDLWWLLNRKKRERANVGSVFFFEPSTDFAIDGAIDEKQELLRCYSVDVIDCGVHVKEISKSTTKSEEILIREENNRLYKIFYTQAIEYIRDEVTR